MNHKLLGDYKCPWCFCNLDGATNAGIEHDRPLPGDFSICIYCGTPLVYLENKFRLMKREDLDGMTNEQAALLLATIHKIQQLMHRRG